MLRRYASGSAMAPMRKLLQLVEPANPFTRGHTQLTPLASLTDVAIPDPAERFEIETLVDAAVKNPAKIKELDMRFQSWRDLPLALALSNQNPQMTEASDIARDLGRLGALGSEALLYLSTGTTGPKEWLDQNIEFLKGLEETKAVIRVAVTPSLRKLITAAAQERDGVTSSNN
jgi:hypothetical protein